MRLGTTDDVTGAAVSGGRLVREVTAANVVLIRFAIDHLGRVGPIARRFLFGEASSLVYSFPTSRPNAAQMCRTALNPPCPTGSVQSAWCRWKLIDRQHCYGHSYTSLMPGNYCVATARTHHHKDIHNAHSKCRAQFRLHAG
ncbi:hypothetical protein ACHAWF_001056 [Thalassiosira exigua]